MPREPEVEHHLTGYLDAAPREGPFPSLRSVVQNGWQKWVKNCPFTLHKCVEKDNTRMILVALTPLVRTIGAKTFGCAVINYYLYQVFLYGHNGAMR